MYIVHDVAKQLLFQMKHCETAQILVFSLKDHTSKMTLKLCRKYKTERKEKNGRQLQT